MKRMRLVPFLSAVAALLMATLPVAAQYSPRVSPGTHAYNALLQSQVYYQQASPVRTAILPARTYPSSNGNVFVDVSIPITETVAAPLSTMAIRGPDGQVRQFPLASGTEVRYLRQHIVLHPGESTSIRLTPAKAAN